MKNIEKLILERRSVRTFEERPLTAEDREKISEFAKTIKNPYNLPIEFKLLDGMGCSVVVGTDLYVGGKMKKDVHMNEAFGYAFESLILYAQSLSIGTVWIGGTMDRGEFERKMELEEDEIMPCVSPLGYPAKKMSLRETMMRKSIKADERARFEEIVFKYDFRTPLKRDDAGKLFPMLEGVRLGPSAVNKQPWRMVVAGDKVHFYLKRTKGFGGKELDMQKVDMGIALCHFSLVAEEAGIEIEFSIEDPGIEAKGMEYIGTYTVK